MHFVQHHHPSRAVSNVSHLDPSRWWFASSGFPMIASTWGPIASALSICALVVPWRQRILPSNGLPDNSNFIDDPLWLTLINAVQLVLAVVSNVVLLLKMARRMRFEVAQPIIIVGWYTSSICLIALTATGTGPLADEGAFVWSQAYFFAIWAAIIYFVVATLMLLTVYGAYAGHYERDFTLSTSQRTLMLQTILFVSYLALGALVFSHVEGWAYLDAIYWADVTLFTVGFGDLYPVTGLGRALLIPYALVGIISIGLVIGSIRNLVLERARTRINARVLEKRRREIIRSMTRKGKDEILSPISSDSLPSTQQMSEYDRRKAEFDLMRKIQDSSEVRRRWISLAVSSCTVLCLWMVAAKIFVLAEQPYQGWQYFDGFYFTFISLLTIGYGDDAPVSSCGKSFFVFWSLLALPAMTVLISNASEIVVKVIRDMSVQYGHLTLLPGEPGFGKSWRKIIHHASGGKLFAQDGSGNGDALEYENDEDSNPVHVVPAGFLGYAQAIASSDNDDNAASADIDTTDTSNAVDSANKTTVDDAEKDGREIEEQHTRGWKTDLEALPASNINAKGQPGDNASPKQKETTEDFACQPPRRVGTTKSISGRPKQPSVMFQRDPKRPLPTGMDLLRLLGTEVAVVTQDLVRRRNHHPILRRYTFDEWAWYLKLLGEDENDPDTHRRAKHHERRSAKPASGKQPNPCRHGHSPTNSDASRAPDVADRAEQLEGHRQAADAIGAPDVPVKWSWVDSHSPLMGLNDETEWILERLTARLHEELEAAAWGDDAAGPRGQQHQPTRTSPARGPASHDDQKSPSSSCSDSKTADEKPRPDKPAASP